MIFVVIPAYNEERTIGRVISGLLKLNEFSEKNIIVVNDGSIDNTGKISRESGVVVLEHRINRGQGAAIQTGHEFALNNGAEIVVDFDGDDQFNVNDILTSIKVLKEKKVDVVFGSRYLDDRSKIPWSKKYLILPISKIINQLITGVKLTDVHNGFRVLNRNALMKINIVQDRMAHNTEIVKKTKKLGLKYSEIGVEVKYYSYGQGVKGGLEIIKDLILNI